MRYVQLLTTRAHKIGETEHSPSHAVLKHNKRGLLLWSTAAGELSMQRVRCGWWEGGNGGNSIVAQRAAGQRPDMGLTLGPITGAASWSSRDYRICFCSKSQVEADHRPGAWLEDQRLCFHTSLVYTSAMFVSCTFVCQCLYVYSVRPIAYSDYNVNLVTLLFHFMLNWRESLFWASSALGSAYVTDYVKKKKAKG